jgi:hypothetical protein
MTFIPGTEVSSVFPAFVYREGGTPSGNVYDTFAAANAAANASPSPKFVVFDASLGTPNIPSGSYDTTGILYVGYILGSNTKVTVTLADGATFPSALALGFKNVHLVNNSGPGGIFVVAAGSDFLLDNFDVEEINEVPFFSFSGSNGVLRIHNGTNVGHGSDGVNPAPGWLVHVDGFSTWQGNPGDASAVAEVGASVPAGNLPSYRGSLDQATSNLLGTQQQLTTGPTYTLDTDSFPPIDGTIFFDSLGGAISLQLVTPIGGVGGAGRRFRVVDYSNSFATHNLTLLRVGSEKIDGVAASKVISTNGYRGWVEFDGTDWYTYAAPSSTSNSIPSTLDMNHGGSPYTLTTAAQVARGDVSAGPISCTLPAGAPDGYAHEVQNSAGDASVNNITIDAPGGDTVEDILNPLTFGASTAIAVKGAVVTFRRNGALNQWKQV